LRRREEKQADEEKAGKLSTIIKLIQAIFR
jgi:hypothetical protein